MTRRLRPRPDLAHNPIRWLLDNPPSLASILWGLNMLGPLYVPGAFPVTRIMEAAAPAWLWGLELVAFGLLARWRAHWRGHALVVPVANLALTTLWWYVCALSWGGHPVSPAWPFYFVAGLSALDQAILAVIKHTRRGQ